MKKFRILMGALALAMVAATVTGCKKEKETASEVVASNGVMNIDELHNINPK